MRNRQKVLVLLSSYNGEDYIEDQIDSILSQKTECEIDLMIRDDGSTDNTVNILNKYQQEYSDRIKLILENNIGYIRSFFRLIEEANGYDFYALSDQDDIWLEDKINTAIEYLIKENNDIPLLYASTSYLVNDDIIPYGITQKQNMEITLYNTIIQNFLPGHNQVMNQPLLNELKKTIDYSMIYVHDSWITNVAIIKGKIIFNNKPYTYYRQHQNNEVGFGKGKFGWINERIKRINKKDGKKYYNQIYNVFNMYKYDISQSEYNELKNFIDSNNSFLRRLKFVLRTKLYRQSKIQTILFKLLYLLGGY